MIALGVRITRQLNERCGDLVGVLVATAPSEPDVAATLEEGMRRHRRGVTALARRLAQLDVLAPGMTADRAAAAFSMMTSPASWLQLTRDDGWSFDQAEQWIADSLTTLLLRRRRRR
jgi:hypothetical protein